MSEKKEKKPIIKESRLELTSGVPGEKPIKRKIKVIIEPVGTRKKGWPRGKPFKKGHEGAFKKGQNRHDMSKLPPGPYTKKPRPEGAKLISKSYKARLGDPCTLPGCEDLTWAEAIAKGIIEAASMGDVGAAREVREVTEGKLPDTMRVGGLDGPPIPVQVEQIDNRLRELLGEATGGNASGGQARTAPASGEKEQSS